MGVLTCSGRVGQPAISWVRNLEFSLSLIRIAGCNTAVIGWCIGQRPRDTRLRVRCELCICDVQISVVQVQRLVLTMDIYNNAFTTPFSWPQEP